VEVRLAAERLAEVDLKHQAGVAGRVANERRVFEVVRADAEDDLLPDVARERRAQLEDLGGDTEAMKRSERRSPPGTSVTTSTGAASRSTSTFARAQGHTWSAKRRLR
jgi:hypothetical protein